MPHLEDSKEDATNEDTIPKGPTDSDERESARKEMENGRSRNYPLDKLTKTISPDDLSEKERVLGS